MAVSAVAAVLFAAEVVAVEYYAYNSSNGYDDSSSYNILKSSTSVSILVVFGLKEEE